MAVMENIIQAHLEIDVVFEDEVALGALGAIRV